MGLITEHDSAADGYEAVPLPSDPVISAGPGAAMLRRRSVRPSRRAVLYLQCMSDSFVPEDLATWYTERGFHFYVADLRGHGQQQGRPAAGSGPAAGGVPAGSAGPAGGKRRRPRKGSGKELKVCFAGLDSASAFLRQTDGMDAVIVGAHGGGALVAALWCHERRETAPADALVLSSPAFGRRLRRGLDIGCPVLVISAAAEPDDRPATVRLGPHVTWLRIDDGRPRQAAAERGASSGVRGTSSGVRGASSGDGRRRFFDEMGRWLGAYMYGQVRDQLL